VTYLALIGKSLAALVLMASAAWQIVLATQVGRVNSLFQDTGTPPNLAVFVVWSQPLMWAFIVVTLVLLVDLVRRPQFLMLGSAATVIAVVLGTAFLHVLVIVGSYASIFELGKGG
jgi:hypothetical protein